MKNNKKLCSVALSSAVLILFLTLVSSAALATTGQSSSPMINITQISSSGIATHPTIYDDKIVWEEDYKNKYASDIYVYNLSTSNVEDSFTASGAPPCPVIYGNKIAWADVRNGHKEGNGFVSSRDIYMYDLFTRKETLITKPPHNVGSPKIYGNRIVWEDGTNTVNIYMYDISTNYLHNITQLGTWRSSINPVIYGDRVVYQDGRNGYPQIYMYNVSSGTETLITDGKGNRTIEGVEPAIYGDKIVWLNPNVDHGDIYAYDISTSKVTQITTSGSAENPAIYGNRIVWEDYRNVSSDIYMYDISTSQETRITDSGLANDPAIYDNRIVWADGRYRDSNIYMATLSGETEPKTPVVNFTSNVTSGNAPLTVTFKDTSTSSPTAWKWTFGDGASKTSKNPIHTYSNAGSYTVKLTATNAAGSNTITKTNYIKVIGKPIAAFTAKPTSGNAPLTVTFKDTSTGSPTSWKWSFGDGTSKTTQNPIHAYSKAGSYTVKLIATNAAGSNTTTKTNCIVVK